MYRWHWDCLLERNISRTTADNVRIICISSDNMRMTCKYANNIWTMSRCDMQRKPSTQIISQIIYMILKWNNSTFLCKIPFNKSFLSQCKDSFELWWPWGVLETMCRWPTCLQTMCGWCVDDICHLPPEISNELSLLCHLRVNRTSSACRPLHRLHVVCTRFQFPVYFKLNTRGQLC